MQQIKERRLTELTFQSYPSLYVGECVPFYFCPRSIMLYIYFRGNHNDVDYRGGQEPIIHLVADMHNTVRWAEMNRKRWVYTDRNAGSKHFNDYSDLSNLNRINWDAVQSRLWFNRDIRDFKQAEFLVETCFPWELVEEIGVFSSTQYDTAHDILSKNDQHKPIVSIQKNWYY